MKKEITKERRKAYTQIGLYLSPKESALLSKMMEKEGWSNRNGYIREKVFGKNIVYKYDNMLKSGEKPDIEKVMISLLTDLNKKLDYLEYRFEKELSFFKKRIDDATGINKIQALKWMSVLEEWKEAVMSRTNDLFCDSQTILKYISIHVQKKDFKNLEYVPTYILEEMAREEDLPTSSAEMKELARRQMEEFYRKYPELYPLREGAPIEPIKKDN